METACNVAWLLSKPCKPTCKFSWNPRRNPLQEDALPLQEEAQGVGAYANSGQASDDELDIAQRRVMELEEGLRAMQRAAEQDMYVAEQNMQAVMAQAFVGIWMSTQKKKDWTSF